MKKLLNLCLVAVSIFTAACTDPTVIGGELIDGTQFPITYRDDISIKMSTDFSENNSLATGVQITEEGVAVGCMSSAYTGNLNSRIGMQIVERTIQLDLASATVDSVVLILPLDTVFQLGDTTAITSLQVLGATAASFADPEPLTQDPLLDNGTQYGEAIGIPGRLETLANVFAGDSLRVDTVGPEFRIHMNQDFQDALFPALAASVARDTVVNDSAFIVDFPGIVIEGSACGATLPAIDLSLSRINRMGVFIYYSEGGIQKQYQLNYRRGATAVGTMRPQYVHDFSGSPAADLLANPPGDTLAIVQSLSGLMVKVEFPDLSSIGNEAVTAAFLDIPLVPGTKDVIRALPRILPRVRNDEGDLIDYGASVANGEVTFSLSEGGAIVRLPDPRSAASDSIYAYRFNMTTFFQDVVTGTRDPEFYLVARFQTQLPGESILVGPGGDVNALRARLLLATTQLP